MAELTLDLLLLVALAAGVGWAIAHVDLGPVLLLVTPRHGLHVSDLVVLAAAGPLALALLWDARRRWRAHRVAAVADCAAPRRKWR